METLNRNPEARASGGSRCIALLGVQLRDLSPQRETAVRTSAITMRPGWLAQAAFFCAPRAQRFHREVSRHLPADPSLLFDGMFALVQHSLKRLYALGNPPDYEPTPDRTVAAIAKARGEDPLSTLYDLMLERNATAMLMLPLFNYADGNHDAIREMMLHPAGVLGLSDGGAHCGMICDASYPTFLLTHWARDRKRGEKLSLEYVIRKQSKDTADLFGLTDRGTIERGKKATST